MQDITVLRQALPYIKRFRERVFVVKFGGEAIEDPHLLEELIEDITLLYLVGIRVVVVHGGGKQATDLAGKLGVENEFVGGRRVTNEGTLEVMKMVLNGKMGTDIISLLRKKDIKAISLSGVSAGVINATRRPPKKVSGADKEVDFGHVGDIESVNTQPIEMLLDEGYIPVLSPMGSDEDGNVLNINADVAASRLASALGAEKLLLLTGAPGVMENVNDRTTLISHLSESQVRGAIKSGIISGGMIPKVEESLHALRNGVGSVHVLSAVEPHQLLLEVFTESGCGTMIELE